MASAQSWLREKFNICPENKNCILTIGNFDGFHKGHQDLIDQMNQAKSKYQARTVVLSFHPHPKQLLQKETPLPVIYENERKWEFLKKSKIDAGYSIQFTKTLAALSPRSFFYDYLLKEFKIKMIIVGYDFNFGRHREGTSVLLKSLCRQENIEFSKLEPVKFDRITISSTMIRRLLFESDFLSVKTFLGRKWSIQGVVKYGRQVGREIGFPTANLLLDYVLPIRKGVYLNEVICKGKTYEGMMNIGYKPTLKQGDTLNLETHIFDFSDEIYHEIIEIIPLKYLREEKLFSTIEKLKMQLIEDRFAAKKYFDQN